MGRRGELKAAERSGGEIHENAKASKRGEPPIHLLNPLPKPRIYLKCHISAAWRKRQPVAVAIIRGASNAAPLGAEKIPSKTMRHRAQQKWFPMSG